MFYSKFPEFWAEQVKVICSHAKQQFRPNARFIFLASYNPKSNGPQGAVSTPTSFASDFGAWFLAFTIEELGKILKQSGSTMFAQDVDFQPSVIEFIHTMTGGHVGINIIALQTLTDLIKQKIQEESALQSEDITGLYLSTEFRNKLMTARMRLDDLRFSPGEASKIRYILCRRDRRCTWIDAKTSPHGTFEELDALVKRCIVQKLDSKPQNDHSPVGFASPVLASIFCQRVFPVQTEGTLPFLGNDIDSFIDHVVTNFSYDILSNTLSTGAGNLVYERAMQMEFYRCAVPALGNPNSCSPDVGYRYGAGGWLDFYVNEKKQWAIELLRNNVDLCSHLERFDGRYAKIPMKAVVLLNFVELHTGNVLDLAHKIPDPELREKETRVYWTPKNGDTTIAILKLNQTPQILNFARPADAIMLEMKENMRLAFIQDG